MKSVTGQYKINKSITICNEVSNRSIQKSKSNESQYKVNSKSTQSQLIVKQSQLEVNRQPCNEDWWDLAMKNLGCNLVDTYFHTSARTVYNKTKHGGSPTAWGEQECRKTVEIRGSSLLRDHPLRLRHCIFEKITE
jgi:hypothetical protein